MVQSPASVSASISVPVESTQTRTQRLKSIDMLRGIAMLLMALDHASVAAQVDLTAESYHNTFPTLPSWPYVLTGLLTNLASGIFFMLTGVSVAFFEKSRRKKGWTEWQITRFLLIRAAILLALDPLVNRFGWFVTTFSFEVLSALAFSLAVIAVARRLPLRVLALAALGLFLVYPLLVQWFPYDPAKPLSSIAAVLLQHHPGSPPAVEFPFLGRLSLVLAGYVCGRLIQMGKITLMPFALLQAALAVFAVWLVLRLLNGYGNFLPYQSEWPWYYFFIESKQPPSIAFLLFNLAGGLAILAGLARIEHRIADHPIGWMLTVFGQTALFFYVAHVMVYNRIVRLMGFDTLLTDGVVRVYVVFVVGIVILVPICAVYRRLRSRYRILAYL